MALSKPYELPEPKVRITPAPLVYPSAQEFLTALNLSQGALHLWLILHALAVYVARMRGHKTLPSHIVFHLPAVIVAALARYSERHTYRLADELKQAGLADHRGHVSKVGRLMRYDGTLWAVKLLPDAPKPRLRFWDFQHDWRPDFAADYHSERGAFRAVQDVMSQPLTCEQKTEKLLLLAQTWAAAQNKGKTPLEGGSDMRPGASFLGIARALPGLIHLHPRQRHQEVSRLAADLTHLLSEQGRHRQWCKAIYAAIEADVEQRAGLAAFALQLERLAVDLAEGAPWKKPGAILAARIKSA